MQAVDRYLWGGYRMSEAMRSDKSRAAVTRWRGRTGQQVTATQMASSAERLLEKIENRTANLGVVGLGYVGLPFLV